MKKTLNIPKQTIIKKVFKTQRGIITMAKLSLEPKTKLYLFSILFIICLISAIILQTSQKSYCSVGEGCDVVSQSDYSSLLGIKNSLIGIFVFIFLISLTIWQILEPHKTKQKIISAGILLGSIIAIYFIYLQNFVIHAWCKFCLVVDISLLIALIILLIPGRKAK